MYDFLGNKCTVVIVNRFDGDFGRVKGGSVHI